MTSRGKARRELSDEVLFPLAKLFQVPPSLELVLAKVPECFGVRDGKDVVRDLDLREVDGSYPCRECRVEQYCAMLVGQQPWATVRQAREMDAVQAREDRSAALKKAIPKALRRLHGVNYRPYTAVPTYVPKKGTPTRWIFERVLEGKWTHRQLRSMIEKAFPKRRPMLLRVLLRTMLSCFGNKHHRQFIGTMRRPRRKAIRFTKPDEVRQRVKDLEA